MPVPASAVHRPRLLACLTLAHPVIRMTASSINSYLMGPRSFQVSKFASQHMNDLPDMSTINQELDTWYQKRLTSDHRVTEMAEVYYQAECSINFPNICYLLKILLSMPITNASTKRSSSTLKFIKTRTRSTRSQNTLNSLLLGLKHKDLLNSVSITDLTSSFNRMKRRRLELISALFK